MQVLHNLILSPNKLQISIYCKRSANTIFTMFVCQTNVWGRRERDQHDVNVKILWEAVFGLKISRHVFIRKKKLELYF